MTTGKICVSVCSTTTAELIEHIKSAENSAADVIEIRVDCLSTTEVPQLLELLPRLRTTKPLLITYRPREQGGNAEIDIDQRIAFWRSIEALENVWIDNEPDLYNKIDWPDGTIVIRSHHDFTGVPVNLTEIYKSFSGREIIKIAVAASDITDTIPLWHLLDRSKREGKHFIPIAMGEPGKFTRILGPAHGAFLTYAPIQPGRETAPGQISVEHLAGLYRVNELDETTDVYGIIAGNTSYSVSPILQNTGFKAAGINAVFIPLQVKDLDQFIQRIVRRETRELDLNFKGFAVTNPHKQAIIEYLDHVDETAEKIGAVNTIKIENGELMGFNTDAHGFIEPLKKRFGLLAGANAAVIGAGGAARACVFALTREGADVTVFARDVLKAESMNVKTREFSENIDLGAFDIIVNTTPVGTLGESENDTVANAGQLSGVKLAYDIVYNPNQTRFLKEAKAAGAETIGGLEMLISQGVRQFEIWTGKTGPSDAIEAAVRKHLNLTQNL